MLITAVPLLALAAPFPVLVYLSAVQFDFPFVVPRLINWARVVCAANITKTRGHRSSKRWVFPVSARRTMRLAFAVRAIKKCYHALTVIIAFSHDVQYIGLELHVVTPSYCSNGGQHSAALDEYTVVRRRST